MGNRKGLPLRHELMYNRRVHITNLKDNATTYILMRKIWNILLLVSILTLPTATTASDRTEDDPNDTENITRILMYSMPWSVLVNGSVEPEVLVSSWPKRLYTTLEVHDISLRRQLDTLLNDMEPSREKLYDVRTVCLLYRKDKVDTLSFWSGTTCRLNGHNYNVQTRSGINLVDVILKFLPHQHAQDILFIREIMNDSNQTRNSQQIPDGKDSTENAK